MHLFSGFSSPFGSSANSKADATQAKAPVAPPTPQPAPAPAPPKTLADPMLPTNSFTEAQAAMAAQNSSHSKNLIGKTIANGTLEFVSVLGLGAYGVVYLARNLAPPPPPSSPEAATYQAYFAVKCLNKVGLDERQRSFQRREILLHTLASKHENVVTLYGVIEEPTCIYVVLQFCEEGDLFGMITETQRYLGDDELIRSVFLQIVDAVESCHKLGIYHRDLKPENILCCDDGRKVMLADFGLATSERSSADFGCGSTFYMSPECQGGLFQRLQSYSTLQNDVWSLGVILVNLTCGRNPWKQACPSDETFRAYLGNPDFLRSILPISDHTNRILKRIFALNPAARINLHDLRHEILTVKTFVMTDEELSNATRATKEAARAFRDAPRSPRRHAAAAPAPTPTPVAPREQLPSSPPLSPLKPAAEINSRRVQPLVAPDQSSRPEKDARTPATPLTPPATPRRLHRPPDILAHATPRAVLAPRPSTESLSSVDSDSSGDLSEAYVATATRRRYRTPPTSCQRPPSPVTPTPTRRFRKATSGRTSPRGIVAKGSAKPQSNRRRRSEDDSSSSSGASSSQPHTPTAASAFATQAAPIPNLANLPHNFISQVRIVNDADRPMSSVEEDLSMDVDEALGAGRSRGASFTAYYPVFSDWGEVAKHQQTEYGEGNVVPMPPPVFLPPIPSEAYEPADRQYHQQQQSCQSSVVTPVAKGRQRDNAFDEYATPDTPTRFTTSRHSTPVRA